MNSIDDNPSPNGEMSLQTIAMPKDTNASGDIFGGWLLSQMDIAAAVAAGKVAGGRVATVAIDNMNFLAPAKKGFILILKSSVNYVANSSMEVGVKIESENPFSGETRHTASAYLTFVSLDESGKPTEVPDIVPETDVEIRRYKEGKNRTLERKKELLDK